MPERIGERLGRLSDESMASLDDALRLRLALSPVPVLATGAARTTIPR